MKINDVCPNCGNKIEEHFNLRRNQIKFKIELISLKCKKCKNKVVTMPDGAKQ